jgi:hypothetical protein
MNKFNNPSLIIAALGGQTKVARALGFRDESGVQRVNNWLKRGIPARIILDHMDYFERATKIIAPKSEKHHKECG